MVLQCRMIPHEVGDGPWNMAVDEALLDSVAEDPEHAVIRTYGWSVPTLSLGYFQDYRDSQDRWAEAPIVRRATGGGALWHDAEVTYAVVVPGTHPAARPSSKLYQTVHEAIAGQLQRLGVDAKRRGEPSGPPGSGVRPFLCFTDRATDDIVLREVKLVGSAQRRRSGAVLQHGSLLLSRSRATPELPGLFDLDRVPTDPSEWVALLQDSLAIALDLPVRPDPLRPEERVRANQLRQERYGNLSWTRRR